MDNSRLSFIKDKLSTDKLVCVLYILLYKTYHIHIGSLCSLRYSFFPIIAKGHRGYNRTTFVRSESKGKIPNYIHIFSILA